MLVSGDHAVTGAMTIWVACAPTLGHDVVQAQASAMAMCGSMTQWEPGSRLMSMISVVSEG